MNFFTIDYNNLKLKSLEEAISYPAYKEIKDSPIIEVNSFDYVLLEEKIKEAMPTINLEGGTENLLLAVIKLLCENRKHFRIDEQTYFSFNWRGLPLLIIKTKSDVAPQRMVYVSIRVFRDDLDNNINEKKISRFIVSALGSVVLLIGLCGGFMLYKKSQSGGT